MMRLTLGLSFLLSLSLTTPVHSCSCPPGGRRTRASAISDGYCLRSQVYVGTVVGVTCNCIPEGENFTRLYCQDYQLQQGSVQADAEVVARGECSINRPPYGSESFHNCTGLSTRVATSAGLTIEGSLSVTNLTQVVNTTREEFGSCGLSCPFNQDNDEEENTNYELRVQPCVYRVRLEEVFKGNISEGDVLTESGPDVLTSCGNFGYVLQLNQRFVVGIGSVCDPISNWATYDSYSSGDIEQLRGLRGQLEAGTIDCGALELLPSLILTVVTLLLTVP